MVIEGRHNIEEALAKKRGLVIATAHTAGWDSVGPLLKRDHSIGVMMVMKAEPDPEARSLQDRARTAGGMKIAHVGADPLQALPLLHHLRDHGAVALQIDRMPVGMRSREVTLFGKQGAIPEGPLKLAQLAGAPLLTIFCGRARPGHYFVEVGRPILLPRRATEDELNGAAQTLADEMSLFLTAHPTQWFHFG